MLRTALMFTVLALATIAGASEAASGAAPAPPSVDLTRIYRGDDGSALYLRRKGAEVYGFGEHPGLGYAYVLSGTVAGDRISGSWWDVPKGTRQSSGVLELRWSQDGRRIVRSGGNDLGPDVFTRIPPDGIPWPVMQVAGFQRTTPSDLDGLFVGDDFSRHYVREQGSSVVWVAERAAQPEERPGWVSVFVGRRVSGTGLSGTWMDVPKGIKRKSGTFGAVVMGAKRDLVIRQTGAERVKRLTPEYTLDWDGFARAIESNLNGNVVGYAYSIMKHGSFIRLGAGGARRLGMDGGRRAFTTDTAAQTASTAKLVSATAIVKALHDRGLTVDAKVEPFLPSCIETGKSMSTLRFRDILDHTSGLPGAGSTCNGQDPYKCLLDILRAGRTQTQSYAYNNKAYDLLRLLVPLVSDQPSVTAFFERFDCSNRSGVLHQRVAERFIEYVREQVFGPVGAEVNFYYPSLDFSLNYKCVARNGSACDPTQPGAEPLHDSVLRTGSGKMAISVKDYGRFLSALDRGLIVPKSVVETMKSDRLGFDSEYGGLAGPYAWKNGGCPDVEDKGRTCKTVAMTFPGDIQAYVAVNSDLGAYGDSLQTLVGRAFDAALR